MKKGRNISGGGDSLTVAEKKFISLEELPDKTDLINQLTVYQAELEMQNEELLAAQESLLNEKIKFEQLFQSAPIPFIVLDSKGIIVKDNDVFRDTLKIRNSSVSKPVVVFLDIPSHAVFFDKFNTVRTKKNRREL